LAVNVRFTRANWIGGGDVGAGGVDLRRDRFGANRRAARGAAVDDHVEMIVGHETGCHFGNGVAHLTQRVDGNNFGHGDAIGIDRHTILGSLGAGPLSSVQGKWVQVDELTVMLFCMNQKLLIRWGKNLTISTNLALKDSSSTHLQSADQLPCSLAQMLVEISRGCAVANAGPMRDCRASSAGSFGEL